MADIVQNKWLWISADDLATEREQLEDEGRDVAALRRRFQGLARLGDEKLFEPRNQVKAAALLDEAAGLPVRKDYPHDEPSDRKGIRALRPRKRVRLGKMPSDRVMADRIHGAWLGRCCGCFLGKPVEGVRSDRFWPFLKATKQWPISTYLRMGVKGKATKDYPDMTRRSWCDRTGYMPIDDDTNYTLTGVRIVRKNGPDFTPADVADFWLGNIPLLATCTAERVAYRNLADGLQPPASAAWRNPYREWIGAQIRADGLAYCAAGDPQRAAEYAWRDASISHVKNGIYGEMFFAAAIAAAARCDDPVQLLHVGLGEIPRTSRLHADISDVLAWWDEGVDYDEAVDRIHGRWDEHKAHHWCHTNSNAMICAVALLWGEGDFGLSLCRAVQPCFDTDCNGATVGSIVGMMLGARKVPSAWTDRLNDTLHTSLMDSNVVKISEVARETWQVWKSIR